MMQDEQEEKQNIQLLYKYLSQLYDEQTARDLMHKYKNHLFDYHGLAWSAGKRSLEFFCMYFLQDTFLPKPDNAAAPIADVEKYSRFYNW